MKNANGFVRPRQARTSLTQRARLLAQFERSGLSAAAFARQHRLHYTTFCNWRQRQAKIEVAPDFVQVDLSSAPAPTGLVLELGAGARLRLTDATQIALAARLVQALNGPTAC